MVGVFEQLMHSYSDALYRHVSLVNHRGTVVAFAMTNRCEIVYSVLNLTDVDDLDAIDAHHWLDNPVSLVFPCEIEKVSDPDLDPVTMPSADGEHNRFVPTTAGLTADAPFQVATDNRHIYLFRQATAPQGGGAGMAQLDSALLVDRFVLSGPELQPTREVRYRRSRNRTRPMKPKDTLGSTDVHGMPFVEPTKELDFVQGRSAGHFAVLLLPTDVAGVERWQIFAADDAAGTIRSFNLERAKDGFFDTVGTQSAVGEESSVLQTTQFELDGRLPGHGLTARLYYEQVDPVDPRADATGSMRAEPSQADLAPDQNARVLLCAATIADQSRSDEANPYVAAIDFAVSRSGRLAEIPNQTEVAQRQADRAFAREAANRQDALESAQEELSRLEHELSPAGTGEVTFYTAETPADFGFALFLPGEDKDVHARYHTASRPVEDGPRSQVEGDQRVQDGKSVQDTAVEASTDRVRYIAFDGHGIVVELYPEARFGGDKVVIVGSGLAPADMDVRSIKVLEDPALAEQRAAVAAQQDEVERLQEQSKNERNSHNENWLNTQAGDGHRVLLPMLEASVGDSSRSDASGHNAGSSDTVEGGLVLLYNDADEVMFSVHTGQTLDLSGDRDAISRVAVEGGASARFFATPADSGQNAQEWDTVGSTEDLPDWRFDSVMVERVSAAANVITEINESQNEQPQLESDIEQLQREIAELDRDIEGRESNAPNTAALKSDIADLELAVDALNTSVNRSADDHSSANSPLRVALCHDGKPFIHVNEGESENLTGDRKPIHSVQLDEGLEAHFSGIVELWFLPNLALDWSTSRDTDDLPNWAFDNVEVRVSDQTRNRREALRGILQTRQGDLLSKEAELDQRRSALHDAEHADGALARVKVQRSQKQELLRAEENRLSDTAKHLMNLRARRLGSPAPLALVHHSTDRHGLTIRSGLLGFAWTSEQPVLFQSGLGRLKVYFTGTGGQFFSAHLDRQAAPARWHLPAGDGLVELRSRTFDQMKDVRIRIGSGSEAGLCNVTISNEQDGTLEIWHDVLRSAQDLCGVLNGQTESTPFTVPPDRNHRRGSLLVSASSASRTQEVQNGTAVLVSEGISPSWVADSPGTAMLFDGQTSHISAVDPQGFRHNGEVTLEAWIHPTEVGAEAAVISARPGNEPNEESGHYLLGIREDEDEDSYRVFANISGHEIETSQSLAVGAWHHVAVAFDASLAMNPGPDGSPFAVYIDGISVETTSSSRAVDLEQHFSLGASKVGGSLQDHFSGILDEVRIWKVARRHEQILDNLFGRLSEETADLSAHYRFDHAEIDDKAEITAVKDSGPLGNDLPLHDVSRPTEVLSTAPISIDAALVRCALAGFRTDFHAGGLRGRPAVAEYAEVQRALDGTQGGVPKRCYSYVDDTAWRLTSGVKIGDQLSDWVAPTQFDLGAERSIGDAHTGPNGNTLLVPMYLKGMFAERPLQTAGPTVDFTYLPWNDGHRDHNADYAPLGEHLELPPMQNTNGELQAGIHLHWTLPPALCRPIKVGDNTVMPYIPVRWEICQVEGGDYSKKLWSDYMHPADTSITDDHTAIPVPERDGPDNEPPYRYMGVATDGASAPPFDDRMRDFYQDIDADGHKGHAHKLTSLGYGDPTFSSYYPNGREILGHHVPKEILDAGSGSAGSSWLVSATLYDPNDPDSPLSELMADTGLSLQSLLEELGWDITASGLDGIHLLGAVELEHTSRKLSPVSHSTLDFALGNTGTEALSAHIADRLGARYGDSAKIEEQIEAVLMGNRVHGHAADLSLKFLEARHALGYQAHPGGTLWRLTGPMEDTGVLHAELTQLNKLQEAADQIERELSSARRELFADWYKYMLAKYPPPASLEQFDQMSYPSVGASASWLEACKDKISTLQRDQSKLQSELANNRSSLEQVAGGEVTLDHEPADRFYSPTDPVLLISGLDLPEVHAAASLEPKRVEIFSADMKALWGATDEAWGRKFVTSGDDWVPFIMEWQAEFLPLVNGTSKAVAEKRFTLHEHDVDAGSPQMSGVPDSKPVSVQGRTFLSSGAGNSVAQSLRDFLVISLPGGPESENVAERAKDYIDESQTPSNTNDAVLTACRAYLALADETILSQSLGGFHDSLIQRERHLQPNMSDPLGSANEQAFSNEIGACVGTEARLAPNPSQPFLPLRAGSLRITGLRLVDVWGRYEDLVPDRQIEPAHAETLSPFSYMPGWAGLRPRSVQPLRLHTDWLVADRDNATIDEDPLASPVVGWLMANHMESSLMSFDGRGVAIGSYDREADFSTAPGQSAGVPTVGPAMAHFRQHAEGNPAWVEAFLGATDDALAQIAPLEHLQHSGIAMLAGRPLAVVRARLSFELMGLPVQNQSWDLFEEQLRAEQGRQVEHRSQWQDMRLPIRLGSYRRLNDGLVGFWVENEDGGHEGPFHSMASQAWSGEILGHDDDSALLWLPMSGESITVTMVIDPRGSVHAATGVLPMKELSLRLRDFQAPLQRLSSWYLQAPLLQPASRDNPNEHDRVFFAAPPNEAGLTWRWAEAVSDMNAEQDGVGDWREFHNFKPMRTRAHLEAPSELREGWLVLDHAPETRTK